MTPDFALAARPAPGFDPRVRRGFARTVDALCRTILAERFGQPTEDAVASVRAFVLAQHARMPDYLGLAMAAVTLAFDAFGLLTAGAFFSHLPAPARGRQLRMWRTAPLEPCRDFVRFYDSLVLFGRLSDAAWDRDPASADPAG